jgi:hypothetical protein
MKYFTLILISIIIMINTEILAQDQVKKISAFRDSTDNAYDISTWLINKKGILLVPTIITEPATGYGAALGAVYFHSSYSEKNGPPSMSGVFGGATQNGTWMAALFHVGYWKQDRLRYMGGIIRTNANLGFYGSGYSAILANEPVNLNLDGALFSSLRDAWVTQDSLWEADICFLILTILLKFR